jgi:hypothetical protein
LIAPAFTDFVRVAAGLLRGLAFADFAATPTGFLTALGFRFVRVGFDFGATLPFPSFVT